jgi:hypothetical protein
MNVSTGNVLEKFAIVVSCIAAPLASGYEVDTHASITENSLTRTILFEEETLRRLSLYPELDATWLRRPDNGVYSGYWANDSVARADLLLQIAVKKEDVGIRSLQHFFDPESNRGLMITDSETGGRLPAGLRSTQWALNLASEWTDIPTYPESIVPSEQFFTVEHAKDYLEESVQETARSIRLRRQSQFLAAIGHVIHHVQDMAQPDHVRNDPHCDIWKCQAADWWYPSDENKYDPSEYESFVREQGYATFNQWNYPIPQFDSYQAFWTTPDDAGMADFTNRFAVSKDTNFRGNIQSPSNHPEFPLPDGGSAALVENVHSLNLMSGVEVSYMSTEVRAGYSDDYLGTGASNDHVTATHSLFALDIKAVELLGIDVSFIGNAGFSINRNTFISAASQLLPRAEAYSAGLINYMLRGRLGVQLPDRGYYALTDFQPETGFTSLLFKLRNETPDVEPHGRSPIPQDAGEGEITAVVSYRPNPCFEDDLSGELHVESPDLTPSGCTWETWQSATDEVRVSSIPVSVSGISREWQEYSFNFSGSPIPFSARDVEVYFVFRGDLGSEEDAIIVERKNISEPTYVGTLNSSDFFWTGEEWTDGFAFRDNGNALDDLGAAQYHDMAYDLDSNDPYATGPDRLDAGHFQRVVMLVDPESSYSFRLQKIPEFAWPFEETYSIQPLLNETREVRSRRSLPWIGGTLLGPARYSNQWCDDEGCTRSGLTRWRGTSQWTIFRQLYVDDIYEPLPDQQDWDELPDISETARQPVTINE